MLKERHSAIWDERKKEEALNVEIEATENYVPVHSKVENFKCVKSLT